MTNDDFSWSSNPNQISPSLSVEYGIITKNRIMLHVLRVCFLIGKALEMSFDHKPTDPPELERIAKAGGQVGIDGRVNGGLNLTRAIGVLIM